MASLTMGAMPPKVARQLAKSKRKRNRPPTGMKIWRDSVHEDKVPEWSRQCILSPQDRHKLRCWEFEQWLRMKRREPGAKISQGAAYMVKKLIQEQDWDTGIIRIALSCLAKKADLARSTVQRILDQLEALGVLERMRTLEDGTDPNGPRYVQGWSAYRLTVPKPFRAWLEARQRPKGLEPADFAHARQEARRLVSAQDFEHRKQQTALYLQQRRDAKALKAQGPAAGAMISAEARQNATAEDLALVQQAYARAQERMQGAAANAAISNPGPAPEPVQNRAVSPEKRARCHPDTGNT